MRVLTFIMKTVSFDKEFYLLFPSGYHQMLPEIRVKFTDFTTSMSETQKMMLLVLFLEDLIIF